MNAEDTPPVGSVADLLSRLRDAIAAHSADASVAAVPTDITDLGSYVRSQRKALGWSLEELGAHAGCTKSHVWEIEQGRSRNPTIKMLDGLARALGVPLIYLCAAALRSPGLRAHPR